MVPTDKEIIAILRKRLKTVETAVDEPMAPAGLYC